MYGANIPIQKLSTERKLLANNVEVNFENDVVR